MNTIVLYEKGKIIKNYKKVSEVLNKYFTNLKKYLKLKKCTSKKSSKFFNTSTKKINQSYPKQETFSFCEIRETETLEIVKSLRKNKATVFKDIPMRIIKKHGSCLLSQTNNYIQQLHKKWEVSRHSEIC